MMQQQQKNEAASQWRRWWEEILMQTNQLWMIISAISVIVDCVLFDNLCFLFSGGKTDRYADGLFRALAFDRLCMGTGHRYIYIYIFVSMPISVELATNSSLRPVADTCRELYKHHWNII